MYTLGISCYYHDSAAAVLKDGKVIAAVEEERFSRIKFDDGFPKLAINWCNSISPKRLGRIYLSDLIWKYLLHDSKPLQLLLDFHFGSF